MLPQDLRAVDGEALLLWHLVPRRDGEVVAHVDARALARLRVLAEPEVVELALERGELAVAEELGQLRLEVLRAGETSTFPGLSRFFLVFL
mgnify:CR=1 FL=1